MAKISTEANGLDVVIGGTITGTNLSGTNTGDAPATVGTFGTTPDAKGATASAGVITMQPADGTHPGAMGILAQTFEGAKTWLAIAAFSLGATFAALISSSVASGSNAIKFLDGARLNFSTADASAYLYRSAANTITTPAAFEAASLALSGGLLLNANQYLIWDNGTYTSSWRYNSATGSVEMGGTFAPASGATSDLGTSSKKWRNVYLGTAFTDSVRIVGGGVLRLDSANGITDISSVAASGNITMNLAGAVIPGADEGANIGSATRRWSNCHLSEPFFYNRIKQSGTDSSASPGATTINKPIGISAIANGATSVVITNSQVVAGSWIVLTWMGDLGTQTKQPWVTRVAGSFTVNVGTAPGADVPFAWEVRTLI